MNASDTPGMSQRNVIYGAAMGMAAMAASMASAAPLTPVAHRSAEKPQARELSGKRVLVTGALRGTGAGIALALADKSGRRRYVTELAGQDHGAGSGH